MTVLMAAAIGGHVNVLKTLIENKADVNMLTKVHVLHNCVRTILYTITIHISYYTTSRELWCCMYSIVIKNLLSYNNYGRTENVYTCIYTC